jgi:hypothetical protein
VISDSICVRLSCLIITPNGSAMPASSMTHSMPASATSGPFNASLQLTITGYPAEMHRAGVVAIAS